jgi:translation initiation factor RLI1
MNTTQRPEKDSSTATSNRGICIALIFALVAENLSLYYEHQQWLTKSQGATLAADWLARNKLRLELAVRKDLSELSDQLAKQIASTLTREAGLYTVHEMMESLDPNYQSSIAQSLMLECERLFDEFATTELKH